MKTTRARRPQPAIREEKAASNAAAARGAKPQGRKARGDSRDEWFGKPEQALAAGGRGKPAGRPAPKSAAKPDGQDEGRPKTRKAPVQRAKRLQIRAGSQKDVAIQKQLREKRLPPEQLNAERLQKALAFTGYGSRRDMEDAINQGRVSINGKLAGLGDKVQPGDEVRFDGKRVQIKWPDRLPRIVIYHKQEGEMVTRDDPNGRVTVFDRLPRIDNSKWIAIGRLDFNTSGLLIFTTSGDLANKMMHPRFEVEREYAVRVLGELTDEQKKQALAGIELEDGPAHFDRLADGGGEGSNHWYRVVLREGRNREVRRMFEFFGLTVSRLMRVRFGAFELPSRLKRGQFYELAETEVLGIMKWAGLRLNGQETNADVAARNEQILQKETDKDDDELPAELRVPVGSKNYMTPGGWRRMQDELYRLVHKERPELTQIINWAASNGDRSENGDYIYGKRRLRQMDGRIRFLSKRLENAEVVDPEKRESTDQIFFSATVTYAREDSREETVSIVGIDETDIEKKHVSWTSPVARALLKAREGDVVQLRTPSGIEELEILEVAYRAIEI